MMTKIHTRDDGILEGVSGPDWCWHDRGSIAGRMGWQDSGRARDVITRTLALLAEGKAVRLTSHLGTCVFQPLAEGEDGRKVPASAGVVHSPDGEVIERTT